MNTIKYPKVSICKKHQKNSENLRSNSAICYHLGTTFSFYTCSDFKLHISTWKYWIAMSVLLHWWIKIIDRDGWTTPLNCLENAKCDRQYLHHQWTENQCEGNLSIEEEILITSDILSVRNIYLLYTNA